MDDGNCLVWMIVTPIEHGLCLVEGRCYVRVGPTSMPVTTHEQMETLLRRKRFTIQQRASLSRDRIVGLRFADPTIGFKDREDKLAQIRHYLTDERPVKFIAVLGRGGIGKTALVSKICSEIENAELSLSDSAETFGVDGIIYYSCTGTDTPFVGRLFGDLGKLLGPPATHEIAECWRDPTQSLTEKVRFLLSQLRSGCYLLVLDNLEGILASDGHFRSAELQQFFDLALTTPHSLRILATARRRPTFDCASIRTIRNVPLENGLPDLEAVSLLREMDVSGEIGLACSSEDLLLRVAHRCYGLPRALEVFAGILVGDLSLTPEVLLSDNRLLETQVVESLIADHFRRLPEDHKRVVEVLAVINKPVPDAVIAYVLSAFFPKISVRSCLAGLVSQYVVGHQRGLNLYSLHPIDQEHAYKNIPPDGALFNKKAVHRRVAQYWLDCPKPPTQECVGLSDFDPQLSAFLHLRLASEGDLACKLLDELDPQPLSMWGHYQLIAELRESIRNFQADTVLRSSNLGNLGTAYANLGETDRAIDCFSQSLELARAAGDAQGVAARLGNLGEAYFVLGDTANALIHFKSAHRSYCALNNDKEIGFWAGHIGLAHMRLGDFKNASECFRIAVDVAAKAGDPREGSWLSNLGDLFLAEGETAVALDYFERSIMMARKIQDRRGLVARLRGAGNCLLALLLFDEALVKLAEALEIARAINIRYGIAATLHSMGRLHSHFGKRSEARGYLTEAVAINSPSTAYCSSVQLGIVDLIDGNSDEAVSAFRNAIKLCSERLEKTPHDYDAVYSRALGNLGLGKVDRARLDFLEGRKICCARGVIKRVLSDLALFRQTGFVGSKEVDELSRLLSQESD
jgi:tetratricopeptide (TPR) repeat protein